MPKTLAEKILSRVAGRDAKAGDLVITPVSRVMVHDSVIDAVIAIVTYQDKTMVQMRQDPVNE